MKFSLSLDVQGVNLILAGLQHLPMKDSRTFHDTLVAELKKQEEAQAAQTTEAPPGTPQ